MPAEPAHARADDGGTAPGERRREVRLDAVHARVAVVSRAHVQASAGHAVRVPRRGPVMPLGHPSADVRIEGGIGDPVAALDHLHVVHQALTPVQQHHVQLVRIARSVVHRSRGGNRCPSALVRLDTARPIVGEPVIRAGVHEFQAAAVPVRPPSPVVAVAIRHFVHRHPRLALRIAGIVQLRENDPLAAVGQLAGVIAERVRHRELRIARDEIGHIAGHHEIAAGRQDGIRRERVLDSFRELPAAEVHIAGSAIVEFDVLVVVALRDRVVHDLVDDDVADAERGPRVVRAIGVRQQFVEARRAVGIPAQHGAVFRTREQDGVDHIGAAGTLEVDRFPVRAERESQLVRREHAETAGRDRRATRQDALVRRGIVRENAVREVHRGRAVVVELHVVVIGRIRVRDDLVDPHGIVRHDKHGIRRAGRTANAPAGGPRPRIPLAV